MGLIRPCGVGPELGAAPQSSSGLVDSLLKPDQIARQVQLVVVRPGIPEAFLGGNDGKACVEPAHGFNEVIRQAVESDVWRSRSWRVLEDNDHVRFIVRCVLHCDGFSVPWSRGFWHIGPSTGRFWFRLRSRIDDALRGWRIDDLLSIGFIAGLLSQLRLRQELTFLIYMSLKQLELGYRQCEVLCCVARIAVSDLQVEMNS